jgi:pimeloyl-ACP methyl ester carboxylesterase
MKLAQQIALKYIRTKFRLLTAISKKKAAKKAFELFCTPQYRNKKKLPPIFEKAERLKLLVEGHTIKGWRFLSAEAGDKKMAPRKRALIVHGFESSVINFDRYVKPLTKKGYEVLAFDAPAHGRSPGKQLNAMLYKEMLKVICNELGPVDSYLAHSLGGLALCLALEEINHTKEHKLVLIAPATETTTVIDSFFHFLQLDPALRPSFETIILQKGKHTIEWFSIARAIKNIKAQVFWLHDENDKITPIKDVLPIQAQKHPHIQFMLTQGLGHSRIYKDNKVTKAIVDFL